jgi:prepilin-type N-terminal cleavage/methylation domain-containing protein
MMGAQRGFTIIEVMIVLGISSVILLTASSMFAGRRQSTEFTQAIYDVQSKLHSWSNSVSSAALPAYQQYTCAPSTPILVGGRIRPVLTSSPGASSSTNPSCIFLGRAVQAIPTGSTIYSYPIFGLRTVYSGGLDTGATPTTIDATNPEPAVDASNPNNAGSLLLVESYNLLGGLQVVSAKLGASENDILTLYSSLQDNNTSGNEITAFTTQYTGASTDPSTMLKQCIEANGCPASGSSIVNTSWNLCLSNGSRQAQIAVRGTASGLVTTLDMNGCP